MLSPSSSRRPLAASFAVVMLLCALGAALVTSVVDAGPASAHSALVSITPRADAVLTTAPTRVVIEFDDPVSTSFVRVVVTTAAGVSVTGGKPTVLGGKVTQALTSDIQSGGYRIAYRVVSDDGHPVTGESDFTVRLARTASPRSPTPSATPSGASSSQPAMAPATTGPTSGQGGRLSGSFVPIAGAVGLVAILGAGLLLWSRRRRQ